MSWVKGWASRAFGSSILVQETRAGDCAGRIKGETNKDKVLEQQAQVLNAMPSFKWVTAHVGSANTREFSDGGLYVAMFAE
jgi:hypothetical protein